jgi:formate C-acetyltransferase
LLKIGVSGLKQRVVDAESRDGLSEKQKEFYLSCKIVITAMQTVAKRLAHAIMPYNEANAKALFNIANKAPQNSYEAMQLLVLYFFIHEYVCGARVRTLGRLDVLLYPFYEKDVKEGVFTKEEIKELLKFFLFKFWSAKVPFDLPFCLSGLNDKGECVVNEMTYLIASTYNELNIYSPKIHIRVSDRTPKEFLLDILSYIRAGNSSFVFVNDYVTVKSLQRVGINEKDAYNYVPIGCYEPAVWGVEIGCTGNGSINLGKAVELVFNDGKDFRFGYNLGVPVDKIDSFEKFKSEIKKQLTVVVDRVVNYINAIESHYGEIYPDAILSCQYDESVKRGVDVYEGGAKYNNTSLAFYSLATLVDCICAVKKLVYDDKYLTFEELSEVLKNNWEGNEELRLKVRAFDEKYGNGNAFADEITNEFAQFCSSLLLNRPNGRGGIYKPACFTIDHYVYVGAKTMATPDGRKAGEPLSKNLCASIGMDKKGITSLINSVTSFDHSLYPNGSVLDVILHPSVVMGENGLNAFYGILKTYFAKGGFAMHGNVFDAKTLKEAQIYPENYKNLQVRVCGWNAYFVSLSKAEQDAFIRQAENNA